MKLMSKALIDLTRKNINIGYDEQNEGILQKETEFIFSLIFKTFLAAFQDKVVGIKIDKNMLDLTPAYLFSPEHKNNLTKWLSRLESMDLPASDLEFGKLKIDFEQWYLQLGGENIEFTFNDGFLLTPQEAAEALGVSKVTLNKYIKQGLECVDNSGKHRKIPNYAVELLKDPIYGIRMQILAQEKKKWKQTPQERFEEIHDEIGALQLKYKSKTYQEAFAMYDGDEMDDPTDYYRWQSLEEELAEILKLSGGTHGGE